MDNLGEIASLRAQAAVQEGTINTVMHTVNKQQGCSSPLCTGPHGSVQASGIHLETDRAASWPVHDSQFADQGVEEHIDVHVTQILQTIQFMVYKCDQVDPFLSADEFIADRTVIKTCSLKVQQTAHHL